MSETTRSEQIHDLSMALAKAQGEFPPVVKDRVARIKTKGGVEYNYNYADLACICDAIRKPLAENGLSIVQSCVVDEDGVTVATHLMHSSGQWVNLSPLTLPCGDDIHSIGSSITYGRRYSLCLALNIAAEDDDGHGGSQSGSRPASRRSATPPPRNNPQRQPEPPPEQPKESAKPSFVPEYAPIKQFLTDAGITKAEQAADAELVLKFCCHNVDIAKAKKDAKHAKEVDAAIQVALVEHKTPSAVLAAAKKLASSPV